MRSRFSISNVVSIIVVILIVVAALVGYGASSLNQRVTPQTTTFSNTEPATQSVTFVSIVTTSVTQTMTSTQTTTVTPSVVQAGLQLEVVLNTTEIQYGSSLSATILLYNPLSASLVLPVSYSNDQNILASNPNDFLCALNSVYDLFGFALYQGYYSSSNVSQAAPLLLTPEPEIGCPTTYQPNISQITFPPQSDSGIVSKGTSLNMTINANTGGCHLTQPNPVTIVSSTNGTLITSTTMEPGFSCGSGSSLFGYWTKPPANESCSQLSTANDTSPWNMIGPYCNLVSFPVGSYTLVAQDVWNQIVYAHFQVIPNQVTTTTASNETCTPAITLSTTETITLCHTESAISTNSSSSGQ